MSAEHASAGDDDPSAGLAVKPAAESGRVEAFSDGVLAIVITLLILDVRADVRRGHLAADLLAQWPVYLAYLASFAFVGVVWVNHHQLFGRIRLVDTGLLWRNLLLLLAVSVLPFPTALVGHALQRGGAADQRVAVVVYGVIAGLLALAWLLVFSHLAAHPELLHDNVPASFFAAERSRAILGAVTYVAAILAGLALPVVALAVFVVLPVFYGFTSNGRPDREPQP